MAQSKCPDPATSGSEHSGAQHLPIFSQPPQHRALTRRPNLATHYPESLWGQIHASLSYVLTAHTRSLVSSTQELDHGLRPSYFLLLPASTAPCPEHFQAKALGGLTGINRAARTHLLFPHHTTCGNSRNKIKKQMQKPFRKTRARRKTEQR